MKLEEGKYYRLRNGRVLGPLTKGPNTRFPFAYGALTFSENGEYNSDPSDWDIINEVIVEDVVPQSHVVYFNLYKKEDGLYHTRAGRGPTRQAADEWARPDRVGCQRVVFTEGTWDE